MQRGVSPCGGLVRNCAPLSTRTASKLSYFGSRTKYERRQRPASYRFTADLWPPISDLCIERCQEFRKFSNLNALGFVGPLCLCGSLPSGLRFLRFLLLKVFLVCGFADLANLA